MAAGGGRSTLHHSDTAEVAGEAGGVEGFRMQSERRGFENRPVPHDVLSSEVVHHGGRFGSGRGGLGLKVRDREWHGVSSSVCSRVVSDWVTFELGECAVKFNRTWRFPPSGALSQTGPEIYREGQFAAELVRRRQSRRPKERGARRRLMLPRHEDGLAVALRGGGAEAEEMQG